MELFTRAGVALPATAARGRAARAPRRPLFNHRAVEDAVGRAAFAPSPEELAAAADYARRARHPGFLKRKEVEVRPLFIEGVLQRVLGYRPYDPEGPSSLASEKAIGRGAVDVALGHFDPAAGRNEVVAPCELKGPDSDDLDRIMPGRGRSPVQQAWDYAVDAPGSRWVLVSNCLELRLYAFGRGREAYESFDLRRLDEEAEHRRLWLLLAERHLLGDVTDRVLRETDGAYRDVTNELYRDYKALRDRLIDHLVHAGGGPRLSPLAAVAAAQKTLDRVLFIAFAERTDLLPERLLERAATAGNAFVPQPLWRNFLALFRAVDEGNHDLAIPAYNGGLFARDPAADDLVLPDQLAADVAGLGQWDYRREVPVTVLGHLFEQSITDIEGLKAEGRGEAPPAVSRRRREGVVYTPDLVTRFLVERTVGRALHERFEALAAAHGLSPGAAFDGPDDPRQQAFWEAYLAALLDLTVVDPACGSGAFLVAALDALAPEYARVLDRLADLGAPQDLDPFDAILAHNLHGVDINPESVEITRLSLWLRTARRGLPLRNLEATIRVGDSLIAAEPAAGGDADPRHSDPLHAWHDWFPAVFARGGFDVVIGNPPYVRMEFLTAIKPYLQRHYAVAADRADLYAYFFERGVAVLKPGGRLGYVSSSTFFRTGSGANLRAFLGRAARVEEVVDFGDLQLFEGVTTYPAILALRKAAAGGDASKADADDLRFLTIKGALPDDLGRAFARGAQPMPRARLAGGAWRFEGDALAALRERIGAGRRTLGEAYGAPLYGIKTGLNDAFVIDRARRDALVAADPALDAVLQPFLRGEDVKRWRVESADLFLVNTPRGRVDIDAYPALRAHLTPYRTALENRATRQEWWELQQAQLAYQPRFAGPKISYPHFQNDPSFALEETGAFSNDKSYFIPDADLALLSYLNSKLAWSFLQSIAPAVRNGWHEMRVQYVSQLPIPEMPDADRKALVALGREATGAARERAAVVAAVRHRLTDLAPGARLSERLRDWPALDFAALQAELRRAWRAEVPLRARAEWEGYLREQRAAARALAARVAAAEAAIDAAVHRLFALTPEDVALMEASLAGQR